MLTNSPTQPFNDSNRKASLPAQSDVWYSCQVLAVQKNLRPTHHVLLRNISHNGMKQTDPGRRAPGRSQAGLFVHRHQSQNHCEVPAPPASFPRTPHVSPCGTLWTVLARFPALCSSVRGHGLFFSFVLLSPTLNLRMNSFCL